MVALNTCVTADMSLCEETYELVRNHQSFGMSNMLKFPSAKYYVERLLRDTTTAPERTRVERRRLAVVSGVTCTKGCPAYYVAEELAVSADMDVIMTGPCLKTLRESCAAIYEEFLDRKARLGLLSVDMKVLTVIPVKLNPNSLESVSQASHNIVRICRKHYQGQLHVLVNLGSQVHETYSVTEDGVEANVGQNFLAPRLLADRLLPILRAAATSTYKPRLIQEGSVGHCTGGDFDPYLLRKFPQEGGAPKGTVVWNDDINHWEYATGTGNTGLEMYYRSKMALMAETFALSKEEPMLAAVSVDPGILSYAVASRRSLLGLSHSQAARSALRAALDPDFNTVDTMNYLHCDGNPWVMAEPVLAKAKGMEEYAEIVRSMADDLCGQLVADKHVGWDLQLASSHVSTSSTASLSIDEDGSESSFESDEIVFDTHNNVKLDISAHAHACWPCHSFHSSLLQYSSPR